MAQTIVKRIEDIIDVIENKKFLLVRGGTYGHLDIKNILDAMPHAEFTDFTPNPLYEQVCEGVKLFNRENCEMIIAVGGGSAIDVAKCIKLYCKMDNKESYLTQDMCDTGITLIAVPTTAGTGSESTCHAVIYYDGEKQSVSHESIVPDYAVLMPKVLKTLPVYQKKCTMLDALCQAIESWWSVRSTSESINYSQKAVRLIKDNWEEYIFKNDENAAEKIMEASNLSGRAINITATTAPHAMSYKITSLYGLPHGHAVALCMENVWDYMNTNTHLCVDKRGRSYLEATLNDIAELIDIKYFKNMLKAMDMGFVAKTDKTADIDKLVGSVNPMRMKNNPVSLSRDVLYDMYERLVKL